MKRKVMKLAVCLLVFAALFFVETKAVYADVISEPYGDAFYQKHESECTYSNETFVANGPNGEISSYRTPESAEVVKTFANGEIVYIEVIYTDKNGVEWGNVYLYNEETPVSWIPMAYLYQEFDGELFLSEYMGDLVSSDLDISVYPDCLQALKDRTLHVFTYPGSQNEYYFKLEYSDDWLPAISYIFTDEEGREWGYIDYYMGHVESWICISDPEAPFGKLYPNGAPERDTRDLSASGQINPEISLQKNKTGSKKTLLILGAAIAGIVLLTGGILYAMLKTKKKKRS